MKTDDGSPGDQPEKSPFGKVIGVVESQAQLLTVTEALAKLGVHDVEVLEGAIGIKLLEGEQDAVAGCFLGDMEAEMVHRYRDAVKAGQIVFAARVESEIADFIGFPAIMVLDPTIWRLGGCEVLNGARKAAVSAPPIFSNIAGSKLDWKSNSRSRVFRSALSA